MTDTHLTCFNINCYQRFETTRSLSRHLLAHWPACKFTAEQAVPVARLDMAPQPLSLPPPNLSNLNWYGTQCNRLNPFMSSTSPVITPFSTCVKTADNTKVVGVDFPDAPSQPMTKPITINPTMKKMKVLMMTMTRTTSVKKKRQFSLQEWNAPLQTKNKL